MQPIPKTAAFLDQTKVNDGQEMLLRVYVHNDASVTLNGTNYDGPGVAKDTKLRIDMPTTASNNVELKATVSASNAESVWDTVSFYGDQPFTLEYVPGSAKMFNKPNPNGVALGQVINSTTALGYESLNGIFPGCTDYAAFIYVKVKVKMEKPNFTANKQVKVTGDWAESATATADDTINWLVTFDNTGTTRLNKIAVVDNIPNGLKVVPGSVKLIDSNFPNGYVFGPEAIQANGKQINVQLEGYNPGVNAFVRFQTTVDKNIISCGSVPITNTVQVTPEGQTSKIDGANVTINTGKTCAPVKKLTCDALTATKSEMFKGETVDFAASYTSENADPTSFMFVVKDQAGNVVATQDKNQPTFAFSTDKVGTYTVSLTVKSGDLTATGANCVKTIVVKEKPKVVKPEYECKGLTASFIDGSKTKIRVTADIHTKDGASFKQMSVNFGDGSAAKVVNTLSTDYEYTRDGNFEIVATVTFNVNDRNELATRTCKTSVNINTTVVTPPTPKAPITVLPQTGPGEMLSAFFGTGISAYALSNWAASRKAVKALRK